MTAMRGIRRGGLPVLLLVFASLLRGADVELDCRPRHAAAVQGEKIELRFFLRNGSPYTLGHDQRFFISYHARHTSGKMAAYENRRFALPRPVRPGASIEFVLPVYFTLAPGAYTIEWDLVREGDFWGHSKGWRPCRHGLRLRPLVSAAFKRSWLPTVYASGHEWLEREQYLLRQSLRNNETWHEGKLFGFSAGSDYPQVWIRDTATLLFYARFFYPVGQLQNIVDHFFKQQGPSGEIGDWVDTAGRSDKNTVESDQESSLVLAAYWLALDDPAWLNGQVNGIARLRRLDMALEWLWRNRYDEKRGLIWSGFTADWGDVERSYADQRAVDLSDRSRRAYAIYAQALFIQAARKMAMMSGRLNDALLAGKWLGRDKAIAAACRRQLFLLEQGYFLVHRLEGKEEFLAMEQGILAVGGNAEAMRAGLMSRSEIERFIKVLEERKKQFALRSVSFTLLPPYPRGFFPHPLLSPWSYQNGGEWDWIGGRLVAALYQNGFRAKAEEYLKEIVLKNLQDGNIFEWSDRAGNGQGASFYAGAAGVLGEAIFAGHFGLSEEFDRYSINAVSDPFKIAIRKNNDFFTLENSAQPTIDITSLAKKEICLKTESVRKKFCINKKGKFELLKK